MRSSVAAVFFDFSKSFEGYTTFLYLDVKGLMTCGVGNLVDPIELALGLPWQDGGVPASQADITAQWELVKSRQDMKLQGGGAFASLTTMRLTDDAVAALVQNKAASMELTLKGYFPGYDALPADAQLGVLSMAWAMGPAFPPGFPRFSAALNAQDWATCAAQCLMDATGNPGLTPRNAANQKLFLAAETDDPDTVSWP
jgi:GH24 family phage-related lysozyme (muramidase)